MEYICHTNNNTNSFCRAHFRWLGRRCSTRFAGSLHCKKKVHNLFNFKNLKQNTILIRKKQENVRFFFFFFFYTGLSEQVGFQSFFEARECQGYFYKNRYDVNISNNVKDILYDTDVITSIVKLIVHSPVGKLM